MNRRAPLIAAALGALAIVGPASATTITTDLDVSRDPTNVVELQPRPDGTRGYGMARNLFFAQTFRATVVADNGQPVSGCLDGGAVISLVDQAGVSRATAACASAAGVFELLPTGALSIQTPTTLTATLATPATAATGTVALSPATSNKISMLVLPRLVDETPNTSRAARYPIRVRLEVPPPRGNAGVIVLQRKKGSTWVTVISKKPDKAGRFFHPLALTATRTQIRIRFKPAAGSGWIENEITFTITRRRV